MKKTTKKTPPKKGVREHPDVMLGEDSGSLYLLDRAVTALFDLRAQHRGDDRKFRLLAQALTDHIRMCCNQIDGRRALDDLSGAAKFALLALRSAAANRPEGYGSSSGLGQAIKRLENVLEE